MSEVKTPPVVSYVIGTLELGGAESQLTLLALERKKLGLKSNVFVLQATGCFIETLRENGIEVMEGGYVYNSSYSKFKKILLLLRSFYRLWRFCLKTKPDVLHAYLPLTNFFGAVAGRLSGIKLVITSRRGPSSHHGKYWYGKYLDKIANTLSHYVTANSQAIRQEVIKKDRIIEDKILHIPNGVQMERFSNIENTRLFMRKNLNLNQEIALVMVANLIPYKGHHDVLQALPKILQHHLDTYLFLVGDDRGIGKDLKTLAIELGIANKVIFLNTRDDVPDILSAMDIYVMASHEEGLSNALLEARAAGLPIVATDVGGNREIVENGQYGFLVPAKNPDHLASAIVKMIEDKMLRNQLKYLTKKNMEDHYNHLKMVDTYNHLYLQGLNRLNGNNDLFKPIV